MKQGYLSEYFSGVATKILSEVEVNAHTSNQHEFNGNNNLINLLGQPSKKIQYPAKFMYLTDYDDSPAEEDGFLTWYDSRMNHPIRSECRLYFPSNTPIQLANAGDILVIAQRPDKSLLAIVAESETTIAQQILWLFGFSNKKTPEFSTREELETEQDRISYISRVVLESIGIEIEERDENYLEEMLSRFAASFPSTREFSDYSRKTLSHISAFDNSDDVLISWMEREEILFRTLEKHLIGERLQKGFENSVDDFISYSLSVQNRRKSRAGLALENHLEYLFQQRDIAYTRNGITEGKSKPDFIFPSIENYHDINFPASQLTMLGVKSTCKDRWRQVLSESKKIEHKHLLTLEAAISQNQTDEMREKNLQLVIPAKIHATYRDEQKKGIIKVSEFLKVVDSKDF